MVLYEHLRDLAEHVNTLLPNAVDAV